MARHPYAGLPDRQFWKHDPGIIDPARFDPVGPMPFGVMPDDRVVTAGSCFAQHVARALAVSGFNHHVTEPAHPVIPPVIAQEFNFGQFSARYGNVYTTRQLLQLLQRADGSLVPRADIWPAGDGSERVVDPFRPQIQPGGFLSPAELHADRAQHLAAVRRAVAEADVFVFTLGLTEAWQDPSDGAVFPLAPGVAGGAWRPEAARFVNFDVDETAADLIAALRLIRAANPAVRIILTVSPVALNATAEDRHVFVSTTWSKAVLRLAADRAAKALPDCVYFPSYEVITSPLMRGRYHAGDGREVRAEGVAHVMRLFFRHFAGAATDDDPSLAVPASAGHDTEMARLIAAQCDEQAIDNL